MDKNRIKDIRKLRKMTQVELASALGVAQGTIQKLENDEIALDVKWLRKLSDILDVEAYELLPLDMQPQDTTPEEKEILRMIRKNTTPQSVDNNNISAPADNAKLPAQSSQPPQKSNER